MDIQTHASLPAPNRTAASTFYRELFDRLAVTEEWISVQLDDLPGSSTNQTIARKQGLLHTRAAQLSGMRLQTNTRGDRMFIRRRKVD